ncbi:MAG: globin [Dehalococcoidia bacterium]
MVDVHQAEDAESRDAVRRAPGDAAIMLETLEIASTRCDDITPAVYERFFRHRADAAGYFPHSDASGLIGRGRMLNVVVELLLDSAACESYVPENVRTSAYEHMSLRIFDPTLYQDFMIALVDTLAELLGDDWGVARADVWRRQCVIFLEGLPVAEMRPGCTA